MIKGDVQISEPAVNLPPTQLRSNLDANYSTVATAAVATAVETRAVEKFCEKSEVKNHFSRLKKRMRVRASGIF